jgi:hypothetical protein
MCVSCGCGEPNERHGDERHITQEDLDQAAEAAELSREQVMANIAASGSQAAGQEGMSNG